MACCGTIPDMYDPAAIEQKWHDLWESWQLFQQTEAGLNVFGEEAEKLYLLFAFAYPSGSGLHVGHVESKTALDIVARFNRMQGKAVFFPVGWDAFGLPAENYAIKTGVPPAETTLNAINTFRRQIKRLAISYDWANELATCHPGYYKWTQWLFLQLLAKDLAFKKTGMVNWCPSCQTVLANEQVVDGTCERCGSEVVQKEMDQWYFRITQYRDELISGLEEVDWPEPTKLQQLNWIGRKTGVEIEYPVVDEAGQPVSDFLADFSTVTCFTTRPDTNFGATFVVIAPEHELAKAVAVTNPEAAAYLEKAASKTELERQQEGKKKTGAFTGLYALNRLTGRRLPIWISDFVLGSFGTGAVVGVPGHDTRDFEFAKTFDLEVIRVVKDPTGSSESITEVSDVYEGEGETVNSDFLNGLDTLEAQTKIRQYLEEKGWGKAVTTYRLRDWLISRQRYWGAPIPVIYDPAGNAHPIDPVALPWELPTDVDYNPKGVSPLASSEELQVRTEKYAAQYHADIIAQHGWDKAGKGWRPEYDTMDTFVDSSWYFLRYIDSRNENEFAGKDQLAKWLPVDFYMIGPEHIVLHLLYSRFFTKFLRDEGYLTANEPFAKMRHQGMILGPDHRKMSKSKGNVINPDDIVEKFGADTLRVYEMFMGPIEADKPWDARAVAGVYRFLQRVEDLILSSIEQLAGESVAQQSGRAADQVMSEKLISPDLAVQRKIHQTLQKVSTDIPQLKFNTAIAAMMECLNLWEKTQREATGLVVEAREIELWIKLLAPFAPFLAEELYWHYQTTLTQSTEGESAQPTAAQSVHVTAWPEPLAALLEEDRKIIPVQVNGKVRANLEVASEDVPNQARVLEAARQLEPLRPWIDGKTIVKKIYVPGKIINFAVK